MGSNVGFVQKRTPARAARRKRPAVKKPASSRIKAATTRDVLGPAVNHERIPPKWKVHYQRMEALREHLLNKKGSMAEDAREETPTFSMHMADAGTDTYDRDWALSMLSSEQSALYEIEEAMNRIRKGTYGKCELTGKTIDPARLEAIPWTRFSTEAEAELERNGDVARARLGVRGSVKAISRSAETEQRLEEAEEEG
jgi:RNA polymerase-binding transcription factor DksA